MRYNTTYEFDFAGKVQFGDMPVEQLYQLFRDGRVASKFLEHTIPTWFPDLEFVDAKGYDHVSKTTGRQFDLKGFTKGGASYAPSTMLGAGRRINLKELHEHANSIDYIISDVTEFPKVRVIVKKGADLVRDYPNGKIPYKNRSTLFG
jgi:chromosome condensin MukBEF MukE localization factor